MADRSEELKKRLFEADVRDDAQAILMDELNVAARSSGAVYGGI